MKWKMPPKIKLYEALGAVADGRIEIEGDYIKVWSSKGDKYYKVIYSKEENAIMTNDNGTYWVGYLGYPAISYLLNIGELPYNKKFAEALSGIEWKKLNDKYKNDYDKTMIDVEKIVISRGVDFSALSGYVESLQDKIKSLDLNVLGKKIKPPNSR